MRLVLHNHFSKASVHRTVDVLRQYERAVGTSAASAGLFAHRRKRAKDKPYVGDDGKVHTFINDDPKQGPCGCGHYRGVDAKPDEYLARVDEHLKTLDPAAKKKFLQKSQLDFERRYSDYRRRAGLVRSEIGSNESAEAYLQTINGLRARLSSL